MTASTRELIEALPTTRVIRDPGHVRFEANIRESAKRFAESGHRCGWIATYHALPGRQPYARQLLALIAADGTATSYAMVTAKGNVRWRPIHDLIRDSLMVLPETAR